MLALNIMSILAILFVLCCILFVFMKMNRPNKLELQLRKTKLILYTSPGCGWCSKQLKELGSLVNHITVVSDNYPDDVRSFPTWQIENQLYLGYKTRGELESVLKRH